MENRKAKVQIKHLMQKIENATIQDGVCLNDELHNGIKLIASTNTKEIHSACPEDSFG